MNKYKEKTKFDIDRFIKEDEKYLLKESRPVTTEEIRCLNKKKMGQFIEDVLTNKKLTQVLYSSNANIEINTYLKHKKNFEGDEETMISKKKEKNEPISVVKKRSRREAFLQMRTEIDNFKSDKKNIKNYLTTKNNKKYRLFKKENENDKISQFNDIKQNKIDSFKRAHSSIKMKLNLIKGIEYGINNSYNSNLELKNSYLNQTYKYDIRAETDAKNSFSNNNNIIFNHKNNNKINNNQFTQYNHFNKTQQKFDSKFGDRKIRELRLNDTYDSPKKKLNMKMVGDPFYTQMYLKTEQNNICKHTKLTKYNPANFKKIDLPEVKLDIRNVYSRLYNNAVLLEPHKREFKKTPLTTYNNSRPKTATGRKAGSDSKKIGNDGLTSIGSLSANQRLNYKVKNVLKSTNGKEFTIKITNDIKEKCFCKYSGGTEVFKYLQRQLKENYKYKKDEVPEDYKVDYFKLIDNKNGNSFLHEAILNEFPELVNYFLEKEANVDLQNFDGNTPLHLALKKNNYAIIGLLLNNKASLDIPNNDGVIPFDLFSSEMKKEFGIDTLIVENPRKKK